MSLTLTLILILTLRNLFKWGGKKIKKKLINGILCSFKISTLVTKKTISQEGCVIYWIIIQNWECQLQYQKKFFSP